jgi:hypothetical protein
MLHKAVVYTKVYDFRGISLAAEVSNNALAYAATNNTILDGYNSAKPLCDAVNQRGV